MWDLDYFQVSSRPLPIPTKIKQNLFLSRVGFEPTIFGSSDKDLTDRATRSRCKYRFPNVLRTAVHAHEYSWLPSLDGINRIVIVTSIYVVRITAFTGLLKNYTLPAYTISFVDTDQWASLKKIHMKGHFRRTQFFAHWSQKFKRNLKKWLCFKKWA